MFKWEWNPNTLAIVVGFGAGLVAWGVTYGEIKANIETTKEVKTDLGLLKATVGQFGLFELRTSALEQNVRTTTEDVRNTNESISSLQADVRVMREIIERIDRQLNSRNGNAR